MPISQFIDFYFEVILELWPEGVRFEGWFILTDNLKLRGCIQLIHTTHSAIWCEIMDGRTCIFLPLTQIFYEESVSPLSPNFASKGRGGVRVRFAYFGER